MKTLLALVAALGALGIATGLNEPAGIVCVIGGDTLGYLSPCGCTKPMIGGIRRRASLTQQIATGQNSLVLENGGLIAGNGRQDQLKAEALVEILSSLNADAVYLSPTERSLGTGGIVSLLNLGGPFFLDSQSQGDTGLGLQSTVSKGKFRIFAASPQTAATQLPGETRLDWSEALQAIRAQSAEPSTSTILLCGGDVQSATEAARACPGLDIIVYRSKGMPEPPIQVGTTWLVTPADHGKYVVTFRWVQNGLKDWRRIALKADVPDDRRASLSYATYLKRLSQEGLLAKMPRMEGKAFAGNKACMSCHTNAAEVWKKSAHSQALTTLHEEGHQRDPDCVGCHVVGLNSKQGFRNEGVTPQLKHVGCESCHGPGKDHALAPYKVKMPISGQRACMTCHTPDHSPGFQFAPYWSRIKH